MQRRVGEEEALKALNAHRSPTYKRLDELQRWVDGTQYRGRPSFWDSGDDSPPLWEREPCIVYPLVRMAIESNEDLMLGEGAFPTAKFGEDDAANKFLEDLAKASRLSTAAREAYGAGQGQSTAVSVLGLRGGRPVIDSIPAKWCKPTFVRSGEFEVSKLEIQYPYLDEVEEGDQIRVVCKLYRRVIDAEKDTVYKPAIVQVDTKDVKWVVDMESSSAHGLGFCPVIWYPFMRGCQAVNKIHGKAIHDGETDEIFSHDMSRSQWHRVAIYSEPQPFEIGVEPGFNPTGDTGRTAVVPATEFGGDIHPTMNPLRGGYGMRATQNARKSGPGYINQYPNPDTKVGYLTMPGDAPKTLEENTLDLRMRVQEALGVVFLDPNNIKFAAVTSGKALATLLKRQLNRIAKHREDFAEGWLVPVLSMLARIVSTKPEDVRVPALAGKTIDYDALRYGMDIVWGSSEDDDYEAQTQVVRLVVEAFADGTIDLSTAIEKYKSAGVFAIEDVEAMVQKLESEREKKESMLKTQISRQHLDALADDGDVDADADDNA